jgi:hypothetical protein
MMNIFNLKVLLAFYVLILVTSGLKAQFNRSTTWCNPINIDYTYTVFNSAEGISYRSGADPAVVSFRGEYYMFVTRSMGYWHSADLLNWDFITPEKWYFQGSNAPAAHNYKDSVLYVTGDPSGNMSVLYTDNPKKGDWKAVPSILTDLQDPDLFIDDGGQAYMFWGSSNVFPIRGKKLNKNQRFIVEGKTTELFNLDPRRHGWERFGENHNDTVLGGYIEGAWMTKHDGKYYLQYAAPGTEFNVYADGVYTSDNPLGPYIYASNNPVSYKPGGFINGAGHGSTILSNDGRYWHFATMSVSVNMNWERRICMFPAYFDKDGLMHCNTAFGDYPHFSPDESDKKGEFTGWMLLSYNKPVRCSSAKGQYIPNNVTDENVKTFWVAEKNDDLQWIEIDLEKPARVCGIQVNYHDYQSDNYGKMPGLCHRYIIEGSMDRNSWKVLVDRRNNFRDVPNDYVELERPVETRYVRFHNILAPMKNLAISDLRIFGSGMGKPPKDVRDLAIKRSNDRRDALIKWESQDNCQGYNVRWGIAPDKLYSSWMVYKNNFLQLRCLNTDQEYYFAVEAFNENGLSPLSDILRIH